MNDSKNPDYMSDIIHHHVRKVHEKKGQEETFDPREVGQVWHSHYWNDNYTVLEKNGEWFKVKWHKGGEVSSHCTPLDRKDFLVQDV